MAALYGRPDRFTPSNLENSFLESRRLSLATLDFGLPFEVASSPDFVAFGAGGEPMAPVYAYTPFRLLMEQEGPLDESVEAYVLPHLPLLDASQLRTAASAANAPFHIANPQRLEAKLTARTKLTAVRREIMELNATLHGLLQELGIRRARLARFLDPRTDGDLDDAARPIVPLSATDGYTLVTRWEKELEIARAAAMEARKRLILAVHHAAMLAIADNVHIGEDIHDTILRLAPDLHDRLFGSEGNADPCSEPSGCDDEWECCENRTNVAIQQFVRSVGLDMEAKEFVQFSLARSRRELIDCEGDVTRQELRINLMRPLLDVVEPLGNVHNVDRVLMDHLRLPTLLGNQVDKTAEKLPMDTPFYPTYDAMSADELDQAVGAHHSTSF